MTIAEFDGLSPAVRAAFFELVVAAVYASERSEPALTNFSILLLARAGTLLRDSKLREIPNESDLTYYIEMALWAVEKCEQQMKTSAAVQ